MTASRARSFGAAAAAYAEHRPEYAAAAVAWALGPVTGLQLRILDLGAGTGKLTGALLERGTVVAVEPDPAMLDELRVRYPAADAMAGSAEEIPLPAASVDAVLVGQAFHWFDPDRALPEIARVLRPGGVLAALWNGENANLEWVQGYRDAAGWASRVTAGSGGVPALPPHSSFTLSEPAEFPNPIPTTADRMLAWLGTHSWLLTVEPTEREQVLGRVRAYLATRPETSAGEFVLPLVTDVMRALRR